MFLKKFFFRLGKKHNFFTKPHCLEPITGHTHFDSEAILKAIFAGVRTQDCRVEFDRCAKARCYKWNIESGDTFRDVAGARASTVAQHRDGEPVFRIAHDVGSESLPGAAMFEHSVTGISFCYSPTKTVRGNGVVVEFNRSPHLFIAGAAY